MASGVKLSDIAQILGVSTVSVSNALSGKDGLSDELRQKIIATAKEMDYTPLRKPRNPEKKGGVKQLRTIGIVIAAHFYEMTAFYGYMYQYINSFLNASDYYAVFDVLSQEDEDNLVLPKGVERCQYAGVIVLGQISREYLYKLIDSLNVPYQCMDFYYGDRILDTVLSDNFSGAYYLTEYLIKHGHKDIGFIGVVTETSSITDRFFGYRKALFEHGLEVPEKWVLNDKDISKIQEFRISPNEKLPTAFVCHCDVIAYVVIHMLRESGYRVPEDISVVGYDDFMYYEWRLDNFITTYHYDVERASKICVDTLLAKLEGREYISGSQVVSESLIERNSVSDVSDVNSVTRLA